MGIVSKIYGGVSKAISTDQGKVISGFAYGIGAAIVILGALFKILHLPGAEEMLMLGMGTEAFLFALGAFEPPHKEYDWSVIYPELAFGHGHGHSPSQPKDMPAPSQTSPVQQSSGLNVGGFTDMGNALTPDELEKLRESLKKLSTTASQLTDISGASIATETYIKNIEKAAGSVDHFADVQAKGSDKIEQASTAFSETYQKVVSGFEASLTQAHKTSTDAIKEASEQLMKAYTNSSGLLEKSATDLQKDSSQISSTLSNVNSNLSKINSVYELQLQAINQQLEESKAKVAESKKINGNLGSISKNYADTVAHSEAYKVEAEKLKRQISDLNSIYGNMLNALNIES